MRESKRSNGAKGKTTARTGVSLATVILLAAFLLFTTLPAALASPDWSDPDWISTLSESNEYAFIAVDSAGTAHVVWFEWDVGEIWYNAGTPGDWPDPELLSTHSDYWQEDPRLALDPDDNVHVVWEGYDDAEDEYSIWYSTNAGGTWSDPVAISTQSTYSQYNARIAVGPDGKVNVVWEGYDAAGSEYWIWYASNAGGTWSDPVNISPDDNYPYYPEIAVDSTGAAHTVWHGHNYEIGIDCDILYATNTGGTWSYPEFVSGIHEHSGSYWPSIAIDPSDNPHVVWEGYDDEDGYYYWIWYATRAGGAWSDPYRLSTQSGYDQYDPKIAVGPDGSAHVVWYGYDAGGDYYQVYYAGNSGGAWSAPVRLSTNLQYDQYDPQIRVGPEGKAHVVWYGYDADYYYYRVYYASNPGGAWTDPVLVSHQPEWDSYYAQIALDLCGNPHVVWDDYDSTTYEDDIWYSADITQCIVRAAVEGGHGMVDPEMQAVPVGGTATIALIPDEGYRVGSVTDNGAAVEPTPTDVYTIENVTEYHEVVVTFVPAIADWYLAEGATAGDFD
ncbi:MAG: sialidase family protein, partial [Actinomycetota bacterium]|nr:sialidase family protein [Actinomycetota bacterium]